MTVPWICLPGQVDLAVLSHDAHLLALASDEMLYVYDTLCWELLYAADRHEFMASDNLSPSKFDVLAFGHDHLAVSIQHRVYFLKSDATNQSMIREPTVIVLDEPILSLEWSPAESVLWTSTHRELNLWHMDLSQNTHLPIVRQSIPGPFDTVRFSCDGQLIASYQKDSSIVLVWYVEQETDPFTLEHELGLNFVALKHPDTVTGVSWRSIKVARSVLLTCGKENVARIWVQNEHPIFGSLEFQQVAILDPKEWVASEPDIVIEQNSYFLNLQQLLDATRTALKSLKHNEQLLNEWKLKVKPFLNLARYHRDLIVQMLGNDSLLLFGLEEMDSSERLIPRHLALTQTGNTKYGVLVDVAPYALELFSTQCGDIFPLSEELAIKKTYENKITLATFELDYITANGRVMQTQKVLDGLTSTVDAILPLKKDGHFIVFSQEESLICNHTPFNITVLKRLPAGKVRVLSNSDILHWDDFFIRLFDGTGEQIVSLSASSFNISLKTEVEELKMEGSPDVCYLVSINLSKSSFCCMRIQDRTISLENCGFLQNNLSPILWVKSIRSLNSAYIVSINTQGFCQLWQLSQKPPANLLDDDSSGLGLSTVGNSVSFSDSVGDIVVFDVCTQDCFVLLEKSGTKYTLKAFTIHPLFKDLYIIGFLTFDDEIISASCHHVEQSCLSLVAVLVSDKILIYSISHRQGNGFVKLVETPICPLHVEPTKIFWLDDCIAITCGSSVYLHDLLLNMDTIESAPEVLLSPQLKYLQFSASGPLPDYHPFSLTEWLIVRSALLSLYHYLKADESSKCSIIPPLPLSKYFVQEDIAQQSNLTNSLFSDNDDVQAGDELELDDDTFGAEQISFLTEKLAVYKLPLLKGPDQMQLLAIIDTVSQIEQDRRAMDEAAVRFVLAVRLFVFLSKSLPQNLRPLQLDFKEVVWAYHSESQELLIDFCNNIYGTKLTWSVAKVLGLGFWIKKLETLKRQMEVIARNQFMSNEDRDPIKCGLIYLAMRKKKLWYNIWKTASHHPEQSTMLKFLVNDFEDPRWQNAALKNAFVLLGKQRHEYAATFFLLGDKIKDAVNVCIKQLNDPQLAFTIARLYEGDDGVVYNELLRGYLISTNIDNRWMISLLFDKLKKPLSSFKSIFMAPELVAIEIGKVEKPETDCTRVALSPTSARWKSAHLDNLVDPGLSILYMLLREKMARFHKMDLQETQDSVQIRLKQAWKFITDVACYYHRVGCPLLSLEILQAGEKTVVQDCAQQSEIRSFRRSQEQIFTTKSIGTGLFDDDTQEPGRAAQGTGLFDDNEPIAKPMSLFDDEPVKKQLSLFDDEPIAKPISLFDDEPAKKQLSLFDDEPIAKPISLFDDEPVKKQLSLFDDEPIAKPISLFDDHPSSKNNVNGLFDDSIKQASGANVITASSIINAAYLKSFKKLMAKQIAPVLLITLHSCSVGKEGFLRKRFFWSYEEDVGRSIDILCDVSGCDRETLINWIKACFKVFLIPADFSLLREENCHIIPEEEVLNLYRRVLNVITERCKLYDAFSQTLVKLTFVQESTETNRIIALSLLFILSLKGMFFDRLFSLVAALEKAELSKNWIDSIYNQSSGADMKIEFTESESKIDDFEIEHESKKATLVEELLVIGSMELFLQFLSTYLVKSKSAIMKAMIRPLIVQFTGRLAAWDHRYHSDRVLLSKLNPVEVLSSMEKRKLWKLIHLKSLQMYEFTTRLMYLQGQISADEAENGSSSPPALDLLDSRPSSAAPSRTSRGLVKFMKRFASSSSVNSEKNPPIVTI